MVYPFLSSILSASERIKSARANPKCTERISQSLCLLPPSPPLLFLLHQSEPINSLQRQNNGEGWHCSVGRGGLFSSSLSGCEIFGFRVHSFLD